MERIEENNTVLAVRDVFRAVKSASKQYCGVSFNNVIAALVLKCLNENQPAHSNDDMDHRHLKQELNINENLTQSSQGGGECTTNNIKKYDHDGELVYEVTIINRYKDQKSGTELTKTDNINETITGGNNGEISNSKNEKQSSMGGGNPKSPPKEKSQEIKSIGKQTKQTQSDFEVCIDLDSDNENADDLPKINNITIDTSETVDENIEGSTQLEQSSVNVGLSTDLEANLNEKVGDEVDYFDMDCDEIQDSENEGTFTDTDTSILKIGNNVNEPGVEEVTIISDDEDDNQSVIDKKESALKAKCNKQGMEKQIQSKADTTTGPSSWKYEKISIKAMTAVEKKSISNSPASKKKNVRKTKHNVKQQDSDIEIIDLDEDSNENDVKPPAIDSSDKNATDKKETATESLRILGNASVVDEETAKTLRLSNQIIEDLDSMVRSSDSTRKQTPRDSIAEPDIIELGETGASSEHVCNKQTLVKKDNTMVIDQSQAAAVGLLPSNSATDGSRIDGRASTPVQPISPETSQLLQTLMANQAIYVSSDLMQGSIPAVPSIQYLQTNDSVVTGESTPRKKIRLLDYDKKWHEIPKYSPEQDKYIALPGGIDGNSIAPVSKPQVRSIQLDRGNWNQPGNYTSVSHYPSVPIITMETVGDVDGSGDYEAVNETYEDNSGFDDNDEMNKDNGKVTREHGDKLMASNSTECRGRGRPRGRGKLKLVGSRGLSGNAADSMSTEDSVGNVTRGVGLKRGRGRPRKQSIRNTSPVKTASPIKGSPSKRGKKIGFYSMRVGYKATRGGSSRDNGALHQRKGSRAQCRQTGNLRQGSAVTKGGVVDSYKEKRTVGRPRLHEKLQVSNSKTKSNAASSSCSSGLESGTSNDIQQKTVILVKGKRTLIGNSLKPASVNKMKNCSVMLKKS